MGDRTQMKYGKPPPPEILALMTAGNANIPNDGSIAAVGE